MIWRIRERSAFERLARQGRRVRVVAAPATDTGVTESGTPIDRPTVWCTYLPDAGAVPPRVAFAFGRVHGTAVRRNLLRRRARAVLSERARSGELSPGWYLVGGTPGVSELTFDVLRDALDAMSERCSQRFARSGASS